MLTIVVLRVTDERCNHLVIDAGRVLVESALADKEALRDIERKRNRQYTDEDFKQLESMMYDNYSVKLIAAQVCLPSWRLFRGADHLLVRHRRQSGDMSRGSTVGDSGS